MTRPSLKHAATLALCAVALSACGKQDISSEVAATGDANVQRGAQLFADRCAGCHTLEPAGTQGSATKVRDRERTDGPNFNVRPEDRDSVLYAIRNGGFSGAIMPQNLVVGKDAEAVADFVAKYAGFDADQPASPSESNSGE
jgi:mono/diheme cytochrome c family protein